MYPSTHTLKSRFLANRKEHAHPTNGTASGKKSEESHRLCRMNLAAQKLTVTGIHPVQVLWSHGTRSLHHTCQRDVQKFDIGCSDGQNSGRSGCSMWPPELSKPASGSRCGVASTLTHDAEFVRSGEKSSQFWRMFPVAGAKRLVQSLPPSVRFWNRAGSHVRQVSGSRQTPVRPSTALLFNVAQVVDSFSRDVENVIVEASGWALT